jgi:O-antigen ligase
MICMLFGLGAVWRFIAVYRDRKVPHRTQQLVTQGVILLMVFWLFAIANSMTSLSCFLLACSLMITTTFFTFARRPAAVHVMVAAVVCLSAFALFYNPGGYLLQELGRNATLTGRTEIWDQVLPMAGNPLFGTGYESFWLGKRLEKMWAFNRDIHQAHNGYLEIYLNLGWVGLTLLAAVLVTGYRKVLDAVRRRQDLSSLCLAFFAAAIIYNFTEAAFGMMSPMWIFLLLTIVALPRAGAVTSRVHVHPELLQPAVPLNLGRRPAMRFEREY